VQLEQSARSRLSGITFDGRRAAKQNDLPPILCSSFSSGRRYRLGCAFDRGALLVGLFVLLVSIAGVFATWLLEARRAPPAGPAGRRERTQWPRPSHPEEERRFATELREDHYKRQLKAWREVQRQGPASLIGPRAAFCYFWSCVIVLVVVPTRRGAFARAANRAALYSGS
jgi:hypothetical protein